MTNVPQGSVSRERAVTVGATRSCHLHATNTTGRRQDDVSTQHKSGTTTRQTAGYQIVTHEPNFAWLSKQEVIASKTTCDTATADTRQHAKIGRGREAETHAAPDNDA